MEFIREGGALVCRRLGETLRLEPWGRNALRVRAAMADEPEEEPWALTEKPEIVQGSVEIREDGASVTAGSLRAEVNRFGVISFFRGDKLLLREFYRNYDGTLSRESRCLKLVSREWKGVIGGSEHSLTVRFESRDGEKLFGMGQYQQPCLDLKGCVLELAHRNSQISVPFLLSSLGYGFLWNNPAVGEAKFAKNRTEWTAAATQQMDYWITAGESPREILENYTAVTGRAPGFPEELLGLWQCKLRYRTQAEVLEVARRYRAEGIPIDMIIIDYFHWTVQGDWKFDPRYWPDPKAMIDELHAMGIKVMVSVWPSVDRRSENFGPLWERGLLMRTERGAAQTYDYPGDCVQIDLFRRETREYLWAACERNYRALGVDGFWLDNAEPDLGVYDFDHLRYARGSALSCTALYPQLFSRAFYEHMGPGSVNLIRCCWAGSQKYGNVVWSGDVPSTFEAFRDQLIAGLNMGLAGIPWWTTDAGGFMTDDVKDPGFRELLVRWFQFSVFSPVLRLHGDRGPHDIPPLDDRDWGGGYLPTGQPNELWSFGEEVYAILRRWLEIRRKLKTYLAELYREASETGAPLMRPMFWEFPEDPVCWETDDQYMLGSRFLAAPVLEAGARSRSVYLPAGRWKLLATGEILDGGRTVTLPAPLEEMPVLEKLR